MDEYVTIVSTDPADDAALVEALEAHKRRRPRDGQVKVFIPSSWRITVIPSRAYVVAAPAPWWEWARAWRP